MRSKSELSESRLKEIEALAEEDYKDGFHRTFFSEEEWVFYRERIELLIQGMLQNGYEETYIMESLNLTQEQLNYYRLKPVGWITLAKQIHSVNAKTQKS